MEHHRDTGQGWMPAAPVRELLASINAALSRAGSIDKNVLAAEVAIAQVVQGGEELGAASSWLWSALSENRLPDESELPARLRPDESVWTPLHERAGHRHQIDEH